MSAVLLVVAVILALVLMQEGLVFVGFLVIVGAAFLSMTEKKGGSAMTVGGQEYGQRPIVVQSEDPDMPRYIKFRVKPDWVHNTHYEDALAGLGMMTDTIVRGALHLFGGRDYAKVYRQQQKDNPLVYPKVEAPPADK